MIKHLLAALLILLNGCGQYSIRNIDMPPPEDYEVWRKQGQSQFQIKKSLLECGAIAPSTLGWPYEKAYEKIGIYGYDNQLNNYFRVSKCMQNAGYTKNFGLRTAQDGCNDVTFPIRKTYPACQPNATIPVPSVERRLNSWYCKVETDYNYCLKHALAPQFCTPEKTTNLPPECLADGQVPSPTDSAIQSERKSSTYVAPSRAQQQATDLQRETQNQNNRQMNNMLKNTAPNIKR